MENLVCDFLLVINTSLHHTPLPGYCWQIIGQKFLLLNGDATVEARKSLDCLNFYQRLKVYREPYKSLLSSTVYCLGWFWILSGVIFIILLKAKEKKN